MFKITYKEYFKYRELCEKVETVQYVCVAEEEEEYIYDKNNEHDKVFREVLSIKEEALSLINKAIKSKKEIKEDIELFNSRFVTSKYKDKESDIVYKVKNKNIFFVIEHQSTIDYSMPYRMMQYAIEIMRIIVDEKENKKKKKDYTYPLIIPIIIYTGDKEWNTKLSMKEMIEEVEWYGEKEEISLVDINEYTKEELLEEKNILSKVMLLEKSKNKIEFMKNIDKILQTTEDKNIEKLKNIIRYKAYGVLEQEETEQLLGKVKDIKEENNMTLAERIKRNEREEKMRIRKEGKKEGRVQERFEIVMNMLKKEIGIEDIENMIGVPKEEIEKIKASMTK